METLLHVNNPVPMWVGLYMTSDDRVTCMTQTIQLSLSPDVFFLSVNLCFLAC